MSRLIVVDFDGTITETDTLDEICRRHAPDTWDAAEDGLDGRRLTLREVIRMEMEPVRGEHDAIVAETVELARVRDGFADFARAARARGDEVVVVSSGFRCIIDPVLEREGLDDLPVVAHDVRFSPQGSTVEFRHGEPCPVCGEECKRSVVNGLRDGREVVYVGDGHSDLCAAEAADRRFARRMLARHLEREGAAYEPFDDFRSIAAALAGPGAQ